MVPCLNLSREELEIRLQCQRPTKRALTTKGKPQNGALLHVQLRPPDSISQFAELDEQELRSDSENSTPEAGYSTDPGSSEHIPAYISSVLMIYRF